MSVGGSEMGRAREGGTGRSSWRGERSRPCSKARQVKGSRGVITLNRAVRICAG